MTPFALKTPMVTAAAISPAAQTGVESLLLKGRRELRGMVERFLLWLEDRAQPPRAAGEAQRRFNVLRLRFNGIIRQFDVFASVLTQRSEHETGVWVAGLDDVAADALRLPGDYFRAPPVICYLDRNHGAAIRRAFTRLPGGGENPVAVISVPREGMIGSGIASSLVHEAGHQGAALLKLVPSLRSALREKQDQDPEYRQAWTWFDKWISEIIADFWSVARIGIGSTQGLMAVVSLPRPMVFLLTGDDPHPIPWLRVKSEIEKWSSRRRFSARHRKEPTRTCRFGPGSNSNEGATTPAARLRVTLPRPSPVEANAFHEHQRADSIFETPRAAPPQLPLQKLPLRHQAKLDDCSLVPHDD